MKAIFSGDREWGDTFIVDTLIGGLEANLKGFPGEHLIVIHGDARGLDRIAGAMAEGRHSMTEVRPYPADWDRHGKRAGVLRNQQMLDLESPHAIFAFHDDLKASRGTLDMCERGIKSELPVYLVRHVNSDIIRQARAWQRRNR